MSFEKPISEFRDPIHGFIPIYKYELEIINDPVFQRLRKIKQLSFGNYLYHGAEHSRFGHVIGVMHVVERALRKIQGNVKKLNGKTEITDSDIKLARFAALLHDVGHKPFSHALDKSEASPEDHADYSVKIVEKYFASILDKAKIKPKNVSNLILGRADPRKPFLNSLVNSQLDVDKFDYLLRDSHYAGVKYGVFDLERLLDSLYVKDDGELVVLRGGFYAAEQLVIARYHMFEQVYLHKTKRCFEAMSRRIANYLHEIRKWDYPEIADLNSIKSIEKFTSYDDAWFLKKILEIDKKSIHNLADSVNKRRPFSVALDSEVISQKLKKNGGGDGSSSIKVIEEDILYEMRNTRNLSRIGINEDDIIFDKFSNLPYRLRPYSRPLSGESAEDPGTILIYDERTKSEEAIEERSKIVKTLSEKYSVRRTYVNKLKISKFMEYIYSKHPDLK